MKKKKHERRIIAALEHWSIYYFKDIRQRPLVGFILVGASNCNTVYSLSRVHGPETARTPKLLNLRESRSVGVLETSYSRTPWESRNTRAIIPCIITLPCKELLTE